MSILNKLFSKLFSKETEYLPPPELRDYVGNGDFKIIGQGFLNHFKTLGGLKSDDTVLDIGSGSGRMAIPLTGFLTKKGRYEGFDIDKKSVKWCQNNITPRYPNFKFTHIDIYNKNYNPNGKTMSSGIIFPYRANTFDFIFLMNKESLNHIREGNSQFNFENSERGYYVINKDVHEAAVAYDETHILMLYDKYNLKIKEIHYGAWCGRKQWTDGQDIIVATKI